MQRKTRDRSHTWPAKRCTPYPMIEFTKFIAKYIASRDLVPISVISAGEHANKILAYALWSQDPYIREHQRNQVRSERFSGSVQEAGFTHSPSVVNSGVLRYLLLTHCAFRARR